jgi:hypothetical protein
MKMVWLDLNLICKSYERIKENQKKKTERKRENNKRPRGTFSAQQGKEPTAHPGLKPEVVSPPSLLHADRWDPPVIINLQPFLPRVNHAGD